MAGKGDKFTDIVYDYCKLHEYMPSRTLAKLIAQHIPELYAGRDELSRIESIRYRVRLRRNTVGKKARRQQGLRAEKKSMGYIPPSLHSIKKDYEVQQTGQILMVGDIHAPFHDVNAIRTMLDYCVDEYEIKAVIYVGDTMDCPSVSKFSQGPDTPSIQDEIPYVEDILDTFQEAFPKAKHIWKDGNHEMRLPRYLNRCASELASVIKAGAGDLVKVRERGMDYVGPLQLIRAGRLFVVHGNEVGINSVGVNPARSLYLKTRETALCFHLHNTSSHTDKTLKGSFPTCWSAGCLCDLQPDYAPHGNKFNHGFVVQELHESGQFELENMRILNGKVVRG